MSVFTLPDGLPVFRSTWSQKRRDLKFSSVFGSQVMEVSSPIWGLDLEFEELPEEDVGALKALHMELDGSRNQLAAWDIARPLPLGTLRGTGANAAAYTLAANVLQGATSMQLVAGTSNLLTAPEDFTNAAWSRGNCTITPNAVLAPDGTMTADAVVRTAVGNHYLWQSLTSQVAANNAFTASIAFRSGTYAGLVRVWLKDGASVSLVANNVQLTSSWQRFTTAGTFPSGATSYPVLYIDPSDDVGVAGDIFYVWGAKVNPGLTADDYGYGKTLLKGDLLGIGSGVTQQVVMVTANAVSTGQGNIVVNFKTPLRNGFAAGTEVRYDKPKALFRKVESDSSWSSQTVYTGGFDLSLIEDWRV